MKRHHHNAKTTQSSLLKPVFRASLRTDNVLELMVYGQIVTQSQILSLEMWGIPTDGYISSVKVKQQIDQSVGKFSRIAIRINSPGGNAFEGIAIGNIIKSAGVPVDVYVDAVAASAASIVAMCGSTITMANNAMMMIHNAWTACEGYASDMRKMADTLDTISASIGQTYVDKTGKALEEITALMDAETWMGAEECVKTGFATAIASESSAEAMAMARNFTVFNQMKHVPEALKKTETAPIPVENAADSCKCTCEECIEGECSECTNPECDDSNCLNCPMQKDETENAVELPVADPAAASNLNLFQFRQFETEKGIRNVV